MLDSKGMLSKDCTPEFVRLLLKHESSIYAYIRSLIPKRNDAEDVLQETCMTLWRKFDQFEPDSDFVRWALRVAKYEVLNFRRRQRRAGLQFSDEFFNVLASESQEECRRLAVVREALEQCLKPHASELVALRYEPGASVEQIATKLGRPVQTIYSIFKRSRHSVFECIQRTLAAGERV